MKKITKTWIFTGFCSIILLLCAIGGDYATTEVSQLEPYQFIVFLVFVALLTLTMISALLDITLKGEKQ